MDDIPKDPLIGGDGHPHSIKFKVYLYDDYFSIRWSTFKVGSLGEVAVPWFKAQYLPYKFEGSNNMIAYHSIEDWYKFKNCTLVQ